MNEELKIIISAEIDKLKKGCQDAKNEVAGVSSAADGGSGKVKAAFSAMGSAAATMAKAVTAAVGAAAAGITALVTAATNGYADYEQLVGGVDTLFKESSAKVQEYASQAYKTAGLSANQYMETVTSFSASLLQSLGNDTEAATEYANMAIVDMADNANKMGSSMESVQNAYQGFAKQNYTMLDNLKLGYGGTKEEMQRLIDDANRVKEANGEMADLTMDSFGDVVEAIHIIQTEMGITGTTAAEASATIAGSTASMKASWDNLLVGIANDNADLEKLMGEFVDSVATAADNIIPRIQITLERAADLVDAMVPVIVENVPPLIESIVPALLESAVKLVEALIQGIVEAFPTLLDILTDLLSDVIALLGKLIPEITGVLLAALPDLITTILDIGVEVINILAEIIPQILEQIVAVLPLIIQAVIDAIPSLLEAAINLLMAIVEAIPQIIPPLIAALPTIITSILDAVLDAIPMLLDAAMQLLQAIIDAIPLIIPPLVDALPEIIETLITFCLEAYPQLIEGAIELLTAIIEAIPLIIPPLVEALPEIILAIIEVLMDNIPLMIDTSVDLFFAIIEAIPMILGDLVVAIGDIIKTIVKTVVKAAPQICKAGIDMFKGLWDSITDTVKQLPNKLKSIVDSIKSNLVEKVKSIMNFDWKLPKLKLPHVKIQGEFSLVPPSIPTFSIEWYAKGGVFDKPTIFGKEGGLGGLGEAGAEAIVPLENNLGWLDKLATMLTEKMGENDRPIILQVDGKTFARTSINSINQLTAQTGKLDLVLA